MAKLSHKDKTPISERDAVAIMQKMFGGGKKKSNSDDLGYHTSTRTDTRIAVNIDTLVQSTDMPQGMTLRQAARKSIISCASDFAAKGVIPKIGAVSVNMPYDTTRADVTDIARGFADATKEYNIKIVVGDTNAGREFVFSVCMIGAHPTITTAAGAKSSKVFNPRRGGANTGDKIFVTGPFGYTALGLEVLLGGKISKRSRVVKKSIMYVTMPKIQMEFGIKGSRYFTSSMDSSDGLASTLNEMARQSRRVFKVCSTPATKELVMYAHRNDKSIEKMVFEGGEEYEIVFTIQTDKIKHIHNLAKRLKVPLMEIGEVGEKTDAKKAGVIMMHQNSNSKYHTIIKDSGWDHFESAKTFHA